MIKLLHDDCFNVVNQMIKENFYVDLICTDPPYEVSVSNGGGTLNTVLKFKDKVKDVVGIDKGFDYTLLQKLTQIQKITNIYIWCNKKQIPRYFNYFVNELDCLFDILFWNKSNPLPSYNNKYLTDCEYLLYFHGKGAYNKPQSFDDAKTVYFDSINQKDKKKYGHPTIKPLKIIEKIVRNSCPEGGVVFDPFMGSGTTGVACSKLKRQFIGVEINDKYFNIAENRVNEQIKHSDNKLTEFF